MKTLLPILSGRHRQKGSVVLILLILLVIMSLLAAANSDALLHLHREVNLLEHRQVERLNAMSATATNTVSTAHTESK